jgi:hypothetical protein
MRRAWFIEVEVFRMIEAGRAKSRGFFRHSEHDDQHRGA